jgi:hypothetical protein
MSGKEDTGGALKEALRVSGAARRAFVRIRW